jgi:teichuronic acid biosynthesis glycosyltransferase TuaC
MIFRMALRLLTFTTLYPDSSRPAHGIFVENRLRHLLARGNSFSRVVAPIPWFPCKSKLWGEYAKYARVPFQEVRHGIQVDHPRYPLIPKLGMTMAPWLMAAALKKPIARLIHDGYDFDIIDAHYFYPDGVAAVILGEKFSKPVVITARGTDINLISDYYFPRIMIQWAAGRADAIISVSQALKTRLAGLGIDKNKITVLRNGVDLKAFSPPDNGTKSTGNSKTGEKVLLAVGSLLPFKGHALAIKALSSLPECKLLIAGEGPERKSLHQLSASLGLNDRVIFLGRIEHEELPRFYGTADALVHASTREGLPNVLLESLACGTPVVATRVGGIPEIITGPEAGILVREQTADSIANGVKNLFLQHPDRAATRRFAERFSWDETSIGLEELFMGVISRRQSASCAEKS